MDAAAFYLLAGRLRFSRAPGAMLTAMSIDAMRARTAPDAAGNTDYLVIAVPAGGAPAAYDAAIAAVRALPDPPPATAAAAAAPDA